MSNPLPDAPARGARLQPAGVADAVRSLAAKLRDAGVPSPELDARLLVCHACGLTHEAFAARPERELGTAEIEAIAVAGRRRRAREPVSRIIGRREFRGLDFDIGPDTLDPRPDTETLVEAALELAGDMAAREPLSILDLGTGSGCILVSLLRELETASGAGTDISSAALAFARLNATRHGVADRAGFVCASWGEGLDGAFDLVVANPPYIATAEIPELEPEVSRHDPRAALDGGEDGLDACRDILTGLPRLLVPGGWVVLETGAGQADAVSAMLRDSGLFAPEQRCWRDLAGHERCVAAKRSPNP